MTLGVNTTPNTPVLSILLATPLQTRRRGHSHGRHHHVLLVLVYFFFFYILLRDHIVS